MGYPGTLCLMNDSFPPLIDGVSNAVLNYASAYQKKFGSAVVATPYHPDADDSALPFPVLRYRSFDTARLVRYRTGFPFSVNGVQWLQRTDMDLIHSHCPFMSTLLARTLRDVCGAPIVFTYHTKFDVDIAKTVSSKTLQEQALRLVLNNILACDEVWAVSRGAGENLRSLGYQGDYLIMENGVDFPRGRVPAAEARRVGRQYDLPPDIPVYLFVGRMMWYKGLQIVFDGLVPLLNQGKEFRFVLIGEGDDLSSMEQYVQKSGLGSKCFFLGAIQDRERLRAWYCRADLFLFPSTYDTNGLVVREAAACGLASVLIAGSCAAEGVADGQNGFLITNSAAAVSVLLSDLWDRPGAMRRAGKCAMEDLYLSWEDSVAQAAERYAVIVEKERSGELARKRRLSDGLIHATAGVLNGVARWRDFRDAPKEELHAMYAWQKAHFGRLIDTLWEQFGHIF